MMPAQERLAVDLLELGYNGFDFPIFHNVDAAENDSVSVVTERLTQQVSSPVRWLQTIQNMKAAGVTKFIEIGPGKVLTGLVRQIDKEATYANIEDSGSLSNTLENLNN
jgi:[acyl-carrier-protein] S-malonyltransferase